MRAHAEIVRMLKTEAKKCPLERQDKTKESTSTRAPTLARELEG